MMYMQSQVQRVERDFAKLIEEFEIAKTKLEMVIVVLPFKGGHVYDTVKTMGDLKFRSPPSAALRGTSSNLMAP